MEQTIRKIEQTDWAVVTEEMHQNGYALIPGLLADSQCEALKAAYDQPDSYRKTVQMERHRFGLGEYKYFDYPLPELIRQIRTSIYPKLVPVANAWFRALNIDTVFPSEHADLLHRCRENGQKLATVLILKYGKGGFNTLHQDLYGDVYFPIQVVLFLSEPDQDYIGGEFVLTRQIPRSQSKAMVLKPKKGDLLIFTTNFKPERGRKGYYRTTMKHGVSELHSGERYTLGIIFHDATS